MFSAAAPPRAAGAAIQPLALKQRTTRILHSTCLDPGASGRRMRRAAGRYVEVARRRIWRVDRRGNARRIATAAGAAVDILVVRALDPIGTGERSERPARLLYT